MIGATMRGEPEAIARQLGARRTAAGWLSHCPFCQPERRRDQAALSIGAGDDGRLLLHCFKSGCSFGEIVAAAGIEPAKPVTSPRPVAPRQDKAVDVSPLLAIWQSARPAIGTAAESYLARRGLSWPSGALIRWLPSTSPVLGLCGAGAMLVRLTGPAGDFRGVQLTAIGCGGERLLDDRGKTLRRTHGHAQGAAAVLMPGWRPVIAEGTETALAAHELLRRHAVKMAGPKPPPIAYDDDSPPPDIEAAWHAWEARFYALTPFGCIATLGAAGLRAMATPTFNGAPVRRAILFVDADAPGRDAATEAAARLRAGGVDLLIIEPVADDTDATDILKGGDRA